jgi:hypothetical protein
MHGTAISVVGDVPAVEKSYQRWVAEELVLSLTACQFFQNQSLVHIQSKHEWERKYP